MNSIWRSLTHLKQLQCDLVGNSLHPTSTLFNHLNSNQIMRPFSMLGASRKIVPLLQPSPSTPPSVFGATSISARGMKVKARVYHRCKDCYFQYSKGILYNLCRTHGRHKQMLKPKYWVNQRILTAVCANSPHPKKPW